MERRDAIGRIALLFGVSFVGAEALLSSCERRATEVKQEAEFSEDVMVLLDEVGETIIPQTGAIPGAKATGIGMFMKAIVEDCYSREEQKIFFDGVARLEKGCITKYGKSFIQMAPQERTDYLTSIDKEAFSDSSVNKQKPAAHYFKMIKELTVWGYFSSEIGATQALRYVEIPGRYDGCIEYKSGDRAWAI